MIQMKKFLQKILILFTGCLFFFNAPEVWALYREPFQGIGQRLGADWNAIDWITAFVLIGLGAIIFLRIGFRSSKGFRTSLALVIFNSLVLLTTCGYLFYLDKTSTGWFSNFSETLYAYGVLFFLWAISIPGSLLIICFLSRQAKKTVLIFFSLLAAYIGVYLGLNYAEINGALSSVEKSNYRNFDQGVKIEVYLRDSHLSVWAMCPKARTKKVVLAMLRSDGWSHRRRAARMLRYLKDRTTLPDLVECMKRRDETDTRLACAITSQMLFSDDYSASIEEGIIREHRENLAEADRLEAQRKAGVPIGGEMENPAEKLYNRLEREIDSTRSK